MTPQARDRLERGLLSLWALTSAILVLEAHGTAQSVGYVLLAALVLFSWVVMAKMLINFTRRRLARRDAKPL